MISRIEIAKTINQIRQDMAELCEDVWDKPEGDELRKFNNRLSELEQQITCSNPDASENTSHLGQKGRDTITGFTGIATGRIQYVSGHVRYTLERQNDEQGTVGRFDAARIAWLIASPKHGSPDQFEIDNRQS